MLLAAGSLAMAQGAPASRNFDHFTTGFPLTGQHLNERCESCHINGIFKGTPRDCASCHTAGTRWSRSNVVKGQNHFPTQLACDSCHGVQKWSQDIAFDHDLTVRVAGGWEAQLAHFGKTHRAIERMLEHPTGMIGLPLRLLAREVYDRVVKLKGHTRVVRTFGYEDYKNRLS